MIPMMMMKEDFTKRWDDDDDDDDNDYDDDDDEGGLYKEMRWASFFSLLGSSTTGCTAPSDTHHFIHDYDDDGDDDLQ